MRQSGSLMGHINLKMDDIDRRELVGHRRRVCMAKAVATACTGAHMTKSQKCITTERD
jgi:hypothetical protein